VHGGGQLVVPILVQGIEFFRFVERYDSDFASIVYFYCGLRGHNERVVEKGEGKR